MRNNSKSRKAQRRERARVGLIRTIEMNRDLIQDDRTTVHVRELAENKIKRAELCLTNQGGK